MIVQFVRLILGKKKTGAAPLVCPQKKVSAEPVLPCRGYGVGIVPVWESGVIYMNSMRYFFKECRKGALFLYLIMFSI